VFKQLYEVEFPLKKVALATEFKPVRFRTNPVQNPYVTADGLVRNRAAEPYLDRGRHLEGMIHEGDAVFRSFAAIGWQWGGDWSGDKDSMHFSASGT
jgi:hypothetical protein